MGTNGWAARPGTASFLLLRRGVSRTNEWNVVQRNGKTSCILMRSNFCFHRKQLSEAQRCFDDAVARGLANAHTYTIMANAHVRCGNAGGAAEVLARMVSAGLSPCVVMYTTVMNGHCRLGEVTAGVAVLEGMLARRPPVWPNVRTINTLLRGCLVSGDVSLAHVLFRRMDTEWRLSPDASCYEYVVALLTQGLRLKAASDLVNDLRRRAARAAASGPEDEDAASAAAAAVAAGPQVYVDLARAAALLCDWAAYKAARKRVMTALQTDPAQAQTPPNSGGGGGGRGGGGAGDGGEEGGVGGGEGVGGAGGQGGKRGWRVRDPARQAAAASFARHRKDEWTMEMESIEAYRRSCEEAATSGPAAGGGGGGGVAALDSS